ncbi:hypothetical protein [Rhodococcus sp. UNC363MFTsu5.1]|uniref:hypothetical protein n=1 Tax=Rhodococcus sp. UNC363MFTsu5.1 TaxID=1449069 RepID=UPI000A5EB373|nr:hypothetical protein [Rhodococcus sp. UNC363MFTsu5.1]
MWGLLTADVPTQWGTFATGLAVQVIETDADTRVVVLSELRARRLTARVPRDGVLTGVA